MWLKFSSFGWDIDMRRTRSGKTLSLGMPKAPQGNIQGRLKRLSLGMPRKASPLSSSKLSVYLTRSYIFIRHMICVLLGAYFQFYLLFEYNHWMWNLEWKRILPWLVNYLTTQCSSLISFGVVCHLLMCFTYILWVNGWMNWIS